MPAKKNTVAPLHVQLLDGLTYKSRTDGSVHTIKANGKVIGEVCVGRNRVRLNLKSALPAASRKMLGGKSRSWAGGGMIVTDANVKDARALLELAVQRAQATTGAAEVAADLSKRKVDATAARKRVATTATRPKATV